MVRYLSCPSQKPPPYILGLGGGVHFRASTYAPPCQAHLQPVCVAVPQPAQLGLIEVGAGVLGSPQHPPFMNGPWYEERDFVPSHIPHTPPFSGAQMNLYKCHSLQQYACLFFFLLLYILNRHFIPCIVRPHFFPAFCLLSLFPWGLGGGRQCFPPPFIPCFWLAIFFLFFLSPSHPVFNITGVLVVFSPPQGLIRGV